MEQSKPKHEIKIKQNKNNLRIKSAEKIRIVRLKSFYLDLIKKESVTFFKIKINRPGGVILILKVEGPENGV